MYLPKIKIWALNKKVHGYHNIIINIVLTITNDNMTPINYRKIMQAFGIYR